jgi:predicted ATPase/DNA-binding winged helix-turn-helix (wHTH) protein
MKQEHHLTFEPFRLDSVHGRVWQGDRMTTLRPRSLAMLRYLVEHPGRLVTKAELRQHVWAGTHVTDSVLRASVQEIRAALGDSAAAPRYLETVGGQGYRFLVAGDLDVPSLSSLRPIVGRQGEVEALERWFQRAAQGTRQLVLISGEAGIGKTTLVDLWLARLGARSGAGMARGQCVEHYGEGEPYLPVLEALGQLSHGPRGPEVLSALRRYAPLWLMQLPGLLTELERERLQRQVQGATSARMLRELAEALDVLAAETPLVLVLEDLQWSDHATVELLAYVAQRRASARLLVLATYRPVEVVLQAHPLRGMVQELSGRGQVVVLRLELLPALEVAAYVAGRLGGPVAVALAEFVHARTDGNALFLVNIVEHLVQQGLVVQREGQWTLREGVEGKIASLPEELRQFLVRRIEDLPPEARRALEAASVVGEEFPAAAVAAGAECSVADVEELCEGLAAQRHFLADAGLTVWPDGTRAGGYRFQHALYQQVLYEQLGPTRREQLHRRIGARLEAGYGARAREIASQLAVHFERGGETYQAVHYWQQVGVTAARRHAYHDAIAAVRKGLGLLATLPEHPERSQGELALQLTLGELLSAVRGRMAPEVGEAYTRAYALCQQIGETPRLFEVLWGLTVFHCAEAQLHPASRFNQELFGLMQRQHDAALVQRGHYALGMHALAQGHFSAARSHLEDSIRLCDGPQPSTPIFHRVYDQRLAALCFLAQVLWALGYADQAEQRSQEALAVAQQAESPPNIAYAQLFATMLCQWCRDAVAARAHAEALIALAEAQGFGLRREQGRILWGWALSMQGRTAAGVAQIHPALSGDHNPGPGLYRAYFLGVLAEACGHVGQPDAGLRAVDDALTLVAMTEVRWWEAELYRLRGTLLLQLASPKVDRAAACFQQALDVAHNQQAKSLELRAALSLSRLWRQQVQGGEVRRLLAPIYDSFTEGFDTPDLQEAKALLVELA